MAGTGRKWLIGCGIGCASLVLLGIVLSVGGGYLMMRPFDRAAGAQKELTAKLGAAADFVPGAEAFPRERLKVFLAVRRELEPTCARFTEIAAKFQRVEALDEEEDVSAGEALRTVGPVLGSVFGLAGTIGKHIEARNRALLAQGMGLGEYTWYYVLIYNSWLGNPPNQDFGDEDERPEYDQEERRVLVALATSHAAALRDAGREAEAAAWDEAAAALAESPDGVPFGLGGLPAADAAALEPWRDKLAASYCAATSAFDLGTIRKKGLSFHTE